LGIHTRCARVWIPKAGSKEKRPLGIPPVENRVVEMAVRNVIEPIFEHTFAPQSYGFRPGRGAKDALRQVNQQLREGKDWVVDADLKGCFDSIPQDKLMAAIQEHIADNKVLELIEKFLNQFEDFVVRDVFLNCGHQFVLRDAVKDKLMAAIQEHIADNKVLELIEKFLKQGVMESGKGWSPTEQGTPQGAVISPLLANLYLNPLDHLMAQGGWQMVRYADDFVILCESQEQAQEALETVRRWVEQAGLTQHPTKTRLVDASQPGGFDFLGYHFERGWKWPRKKSLDKFKESIREKTRRLRNGAMSQIKSEINPSIRGWGEYFKHSVTNELTKMDQWIRGRLRTINRRRHKGQGRARGRDHQKWPNAYFAELGLISIALIREQAAKAR
jgi:RNA-directed DNA polymerase